MESKTEHFLFADDLESEQTWMLLAWCQARGASELTIDLLGLQDHPEPFCDRFRDAMAEFRLADAAREKMVTYSGDPWVRPTPLWRLTPESIQILRSFLDEGLFTYPAGDWPTGCLENPTFYRAGEVMLGIVSHEREGILRLLTSEQADFGALCIPWRDQPEWI
jgi:hypothetical protein